MNYAFIPVRGGSKSIPLKNIKMICGKPLAYWTIKAACECKKIDKVFVATDSDKIKTALRKYTCDDVFGKLNIIDRSKENATDTASTESVMLEFANNYDFDNICLIQATSPLLTSDDLTVGFSIYSEDNVDSVLSVVNQKRFYWMDDENGFASAQNYDYMKRPRRQEFKGSFVENGAFYITSRKRLLETKNRISGNIKMAIMPEDTFLEIDEPSDWKQIELLLKKRMAHHGEKYKMVLTDCDGCLTDGGMYYSEFGDELKKFNTKDGMAVSILKKHDILTGIITGEDVRLNERRAQKIGVDIFIPGCKDKLQAAEKILAEYNIGFEEVVYIGDDVNDIELLKAVGRSFCPNDAVDAVKDCVDIVLTSCGGNGVLREVIQQLGLDVE